MKPLSAALRLFAGAALGLVFIAWGAAGGSVAGAAQAPAGTVVLLAQADTSGVPVFEGDDEVDEEEEEVPIPPNLMEEKETLPDTAGTAAPDTLREALPAAPALPDTLHPNQPPPSVSARPPGSPPPSAPAKPKGSLFGLAPVVVIAMIVVVNVFLIRAVGG